jgi:GNAT superfamily N-acetyltransferase
MRPEDVPLAERLSSDAFYQADLQSSPPWWPAPQPRPSSRADGWVARTRRFLETDADGCWAAVDDSGLVGFATSIRRESLWCLVTYAVRPGLQGQGIGTRLLDAALRHGAAADRWMLSASDDPGAVRRYRLAGFDLHPQMFLHGRVDRAAIPAVTGLRDGTPDDVELLDSLDRELRGAGHGPDHEALARMGELVVDVRGQGYAYAGGGGPAVIAAVDEETAVRLLWECLGRAGDEPIVGHITAANQWALDVGLAARLAIATQGYLGLRGMSPPAPYVHNGALL